MRRGRGLRLVERFQKCQEGESDLVVMMADISIYETRFSRDRPRFTDTLDMIKFLCKDMWTLVFRKQIDNLKTNHRVRLFFLLSPDFPLFSGEGVYRRVRRALA